MLLTRNQCLVEQRGKAAHIAESPLLLGVRWLRIEFSRSVAMVAQCILFLYDNDEPDSEL